MIKYYCDKCGKSSVKRQTGFVGKTKALNDDQVVVQVNFNMEDSTVDNERHFCMKCMVDMTRKLCDSLMEKKHKGEKND